MLGSAWKMAKGIALHKSHTKYFTQSTNYKMIHTALHAGKENYNERHK